MCKETSGRQESVIAFHTELSILTSESDSKQAGTLTSASKGSWWRERFTETLQSRRVAGQRMRNLTCRGARERIGNVMPSVQNAVQNAELHFYFFSPARSARSSLRSFVPAKVTAPALPLHWGRPGAAAICCHAAAWCDGQLRIQFSRLRISVLRFQVEL